MLPLLIRESFPIPSPEDNIWPDVELSPEEFESAYIEFSVYARRLKCARYGCGGLVILVRITQPGISESISKEQLMKK